MARNPFQQLLKPFRHVRQAANIPAPTIIVQLKLPSRITAHRRTPQRKPLPNPLNTLNRQPNSAAKPLPADVLLLKCYPITLVLRSGVIVLMGASISQGCSTEPYSFANILLGRHMRNYREVLPQWSKNVR